MKKNALIVCNAPLPPQKLIDPILRENPLIICADGGANRLWRRGIQPEFIVGDLDSLQPQLRRIFSPEKIVYNPGQENSDLEKALDFALSQGITQAVVIGATGRRPDHTMVNFSILLKYHQKLYLEFLDAHCTMRLLTGDCQVPLAVGTTISLLPMGTCEGVRTHGLRYPLNDEPLILGTRESLSNLVEENPVSIHVRQGYLLLFVVHKR